MNKKNITLMVIAIVTLLSVVVLATYAYFTGTVNVNNQAYCAKANVPDPT